MKGSKGDDGGKDLRERQMRKKKGKRAIVCESRTLVDHLTEELVSEFLTRLPAKKLLQCMCVSKGWCSIIRDPMFFGAWLRQQRHGSLLVSVGDFQGGLGWGVYCAPLLQSEEDAGPFFSLIKLPAYDFLKGVTQVVNGLVCAYGSNLPRVYNVCTREFMWLPEISGSRNPVYEDHYFGYHPGEKLYKWLRISRSDSMQEAHILTLGLDSSWRKLDISCNQSERLPKKSFLCNGVLYWMLYGLREQLGLISFDLKTEKFQFITAPKDPEFLLKSYSWTPAQFMGRLAVSVNGSSECFVLHTLEKCDDRGCCSWSRHAIPLPPGFGGEDRWNILPVGNLPTGHILLTDMRLWKDSASFVPVYSYDHQKNKFERFIVGRIPGETMRGLNFTASYVAKEKIVGLDVLFDQRVKAKAEASRFYQLLM